MKLKTLFEDDGAVSPVIGVILMVAITVILAAVIGTFVLGMGENVQQNAQAGVSFSHSNGDVEVQLTSLGNVDGADKVTVRAADGCEVASQGTTDPDSMSFGDVGDIITVQEEDNDGVTCSGKITVVAELDGSTNVIANEEI